MKILYKQVKAIMPHCGECGEQMSGNGTDIFPYECSCGKWRMKAPEYRSNEYELWT